ncbi:SRPBCC family protein [Aporhodopirellula aestuarii]|uniref:SRPBCC family protein n=1 Tax=Aporhodopirellula aestuarii TaxID=2950107 RepID=A0ABT0U9H8_9BACT|nr:SRPBCC family protein [Aporhodopirellula aestuarii]MCM2373639.1 SRPBCC family protein [Aporhodopirellula aestuarii]
MNKSTTDRIEKQIEIDAPVSRVWQSITDSQEFGQWFRVNLEGPFVVGEVTRGQITYPGYEHVTMEVIVEAIEPDDRFAFWWRPYAIDPNVDYSAEPRTLVEFTLEPTATGTLVRVSESGFDGIPAHRRDEAFRMNDGGWAAQVVNVRDHVHANP